MLSSVTKNTSGCRAILRFSGSRTTYGQSLWHCVSFMALITGKLICFCRRAIRTFRRGPNYWKFFAFPGGVFLIERIYRYIKRRQPARLKSVTIMENPRVLGACSISPCVLVAGSQSGIRQDWPLGAPRENVQRHQSRASSVCWSCESSLTTELRRHLDGQYAYIRCPTISE